MYPVSYITGLTSYLATNRRAPRLREPQTFSTTTHTKVSPGCRRGRGLPGGCGHADNVNLEKIEDEGERRQIEAIINNFGQTPTQLFTEPHPQRMSSHEARRSVARGYRKKSSYNLLEHLDYVKTHFVDVSHNYIIMM